MMFIPQLRDRLQMKVAKVRFSATRRPFALTSSFKLPLMKRLLRFAGFLALVVLAKPTQAQEKPHFNHTTIYVTDLARGTEFYSKVMMLEPIPEPFHDGRHSWFKMGEHSELHVVSGAKEDVSHDVNIHLAFAVPSLPDFMKHLDKLGIKYGNFGGETNKIAIRPDKINQIYFQDPDGYWIEVNDDKF
jgi:lactoylglutathione lyase